MRHYAVYEKTLTYTFPDGEKVYKYLPKGEPVKHHAPEYSKPFFTPGYTQYKWRRLFNAVSELYDRYPGLKEAILPLNSRYVEALAPDLKP